MPANFVEAALIACNGALAEQLVLGENSFPKFLLGPKRL